MDKCDIYLNASILFGAVVGGIYAENIVEEPVADTIIGTVIGMTVGPIMPLLAPGLLWKYVKQMRETRKEK